MGSSTTKVGHSLDMLASLSEVEPLKGALIAASVDDPERVWASSGIYRTIESRLVPLDALEAAIPRLLAEESARREAVWRHTVAALRGVSEGDPAAAARAMVSAGEVEEEAGRFAAAEALYTRALELGRRPRDRRAEGLALRRLARVAKARGALGEASRRYRQGYDVAVAQNDVEGMIVGCQGLGNCYVDEGRWEEAERWYREGLALLGDRKVRERWQLESNLSIVARRAGGLEESEQSLAAARSTAAETGDADAEVFLANAEGLLRVAQRRFADAEGIYRSTAGLALTPAQRLTVLLNLAECLLLDGRAGESAAEAREAERIAIAAGLDSMLLHVYLALGAAARKEGAPEALVFFEQALDLARASENPAELALVQREYAGLDRAQGAIDSAIARLREAAGIFRACGSVPELDATLRELEALGGSAGGG